LRYELLLDGLRVRPVKAWARELLKLPFWFALAEFEPAVSLLVCFAMLLFDADAV